MHNFSSAKLQLRRQAWNTFFLWFSAQAQGAVSLNVGIMGRKRGHVLGRSAFQAHHTFCTHPRTSSPVTVALICSAFQALNTHGNEICTASSFWTAVRNVVLWGGKGGLSCGVVPSRHYAIGLAILPQAQRRHFLLEIFFFLADIFSYLPQSFSYPIR